jgi:hypothetical protein
VSAPDKSRSGAYAFGAVGLVLFGCGMYMFVSRAFAVATWSPARATVTATRSEAIGASKYDAHIYVRFDAGGRTIETEVEHDFRRASGTLVEEALVRHAPGTDVAILYAPGDPRRARIAAGWNPATFFASLLALACGALFASIGWLGARDVDLAEEEVGTTEHGRAPAAERTRMVVTGGFLVSSGLATAAAAVSHLRSAARLSAPVLLLAAGLAATAAGVLALRLSRR